MQVQYYLWAMVQFLTKTNCWCELLLWNNLAVAVECDVDKSGEWYASWLALRCMCQCHWMKWHFSKRTSGLFVLFLFLVLPLRWGETPLYTNVTDNIFFSPPTLLGVGGGGGFNTVTTVTSGTHPEKTKNQKNVSPRNQQRQKLSRLFRFDWCGLFY